MVHITKGDDQAVLFEPSMGSIKCISLPLLPSWKTLAIPLFTGKLIIGKTFIVDGN